MSQADISSPNHESPYQSADFTRPFLAIRQQLLESGRYPPGLTGACYVSAFLCDFLLKQQGVESDIGTNGKHAFNRIHADGKTYLLDLTATQVSKDRFDVVSVLEEDEAKSLLTRRKRDFYESKLVFADSQDLLMPREGEALKIADRLVEPLTDILGEPSLYTTFSDIDSYPTLDAFAGYLVRRFEDFVAEITAQPESAPEPVKPAQPQRRTHAVSHGVSGP